MFWAWGQATIPVIDNLCVAFGVRLLIQNVGPKIPKITQTKLYTSSIALLSRPAAGCNVPQRKAFREAPVAFEFLLAEGESG